jgi:hypothetical protein
MSTRIMIASGFVAPFLAGLGVGQVLHGHSWGYLMIAVGLAASVPFFTRMARTFPWQARRRHHPAAEGKR